MSNKTSHIEVNPEMGKMMATTFVICRKGKSSFVKDGTGGDTGTPAQYMDTSKTLFVEPISRLYLGRGKGYRQTQYVVGASTHYIEDYYETSTGDLVLEAVTPEQGKNKSYQFRPGLRSQGYKLQEEYATSINKGICFEFGKLELARYGDDPVLLRFIMEHEQNISSPRASENMDPKRLRLFSFRPFMPEVEAQKSDSLENFDDDVKAMLLVSDLRSKTTSGYKYDEKKMDALLSVLGDGVGLKGGDVNQKFAIITRYAKGNGSVFVQLIEGAFEEYRMQITIAEQLKKLVFSATDVKLISGTASTPIIQLDKAPKEKCVDDLIVFFMGTEIGQSTFMEMCREVEIAKLEKNN